MDGSSSDSSRPAGRPSCAIVVPCYNEQNRFEADRFADFLALNHPIQFCFVNDGSKDGTLAILERFRVVHPDRVTVIDLQPNGGKGEAVRRAMIEMIARPEVEFVGFWDADLATPLTALPKFLRAIQEQPQVAMVFGARVRLLGRNVKRNPIRHYLGRGFATAVSTMLGLPIYDTQCGAKLFRVTPELSQILAKPFQSRWIFDVEIIARFMCLPGIGSSGAEDAIYELPLDTWHDIAGSKLSSSDFLRSVGELAKIRKTYFGSIFPRSAT